MDITSALIEIIKHTHSTDGGQDSAYERLEDIRAIAKEVLRSIDPSAEEDVSLEVQDIS
jgi:hypothetical protein